MKCKKYVQLPAIYLITLIIYYGFVSHELLNNALLHYDIFVFSVVSMLVYSMSKDDVLVRLELYRYANIKDYFKDILLDGCMNLLVLIVIINIINNLFLIILGVDIDLIKSLYYMINQYMCLLLFYLLLMVNIFDKHYNIKKMFIMIMFLGFYFLAILNNGDLTPFNPFIAYFSDIHVGIYRMTVYPLYGFLIYWYYERKMKDLEL